MINMFEGICCFYYKNIFNAKTTDDKHIWNNCIIDYENMELRLLSSNRLYAKLYFKEGVLIMLYASSIGFTEEHEAPISLSRKIENYLCEKYLLKE